MRLLLVTWADAASFHIGWAEPDEVDSKAPHQVRSVGWERRRVGEAPAGFLQLVASVVDDGSMSGDVIIPLGCILEERVLA
jgi:hypothetical protein